jgi:hypothetical protein
VQWPVSSDIPRISSITLRDEFSGLIFARALADDLHRPLPSYATRSGSDFWDNNRNSTFFVAKIIGARSRYVNARLGAAARSALCAIY